MVAWIQAFSDEVRRFTGRRPVICTTTHWWNLCTGGSSSVFAADHPLWIARYGAGPGTLPAGWSFWTIRQYDNGGSPPGDQNLFNGSTDRLRAFVNGS